MSDVELEGDLLRHLADLPIRVERVKYLEGSDRDREAEIIKAVSKAASNALSAKQSVERSHPTREQIARLICERANHSPGDIADAVLALLPPATAVTDAMVEAVYNRACEIREQNPASSVLWWYRQVIEAALAAQAPPQREALSEVERLQAVIERERTQSSRWLGRITAEIARWYHVSEGRGPYEWDDERYRAEFKNAMDAIRSACDKAAKDCNIHSFHDCPPTQELVAKARSEAPPQAERCAECGRSAGCSEHIIGDDGSGHAFVAPQAAAEPAASDRNE